MVVLLRLVISCNQFKNRQLHRNIDGRFENEKVHGKDIRGKVDNS